MFLNTSRPGPTVTVALLSLGGLFLAGCGVSTRAGKGVVALPGRAIKGHAHGGVFPIQGATVRLMETQSNGYGGAAIQLLQTTSDNSGYFTFPDTGWTCDSNQFAYVTVTSGHTSSNAVNNNVGQIGIIGNCGEFLSSTAEIDAVQVYLSELSTIAAAYALRGFITIDNTNAATGQQIVNISAPPNNNAPSGVCTFTTPTTCVAAGLAHGFENAFNLVDSVNFYGTLPTGTARTTPPTNGFAFVPQAMINTLGNILQSCVDSPGGTVGTYSTYTPGGTSSTLCGDLFYYATPPGGTSPTNTLQVALNMAQYPTNKAASLFALQPRAVFFTPTLSQAPNDLSLSIFYVTQDFGAYTGGLTNPVGLSLDANDDAFILATTGQGSANTSTAVLGLATNGDVLFAGSGSTTYLSPVGITTDALDNIWFTNDDSSAGAILKADPSSGNISVGTTLANAAGIAVDRFNNVWVSVDGTQGNSILEYSTASLAGTTATPLVASNSLGTPLTTLAIDGQQNLWALNASSTSTAPTVLRNLGTANTPAYNTSLITQSFTSGNGAGIAFNSNNEAFLPLKNQLDDASFANGQLALNNLGLFNGTAQNSAPYNSPSQTEVDGAGSVFWTDLEANGELYQFVPSSGGTMSQGTLHAMLPCYPVNGTCYIPAVANARGMQIDSTGALWYVADASFYGAPIGIVVQTFGVGTPTWPQQSLGRPGVKPQ